MQRRLLQSLLGFPGSCAQEQRLGQRGDFSGEYLEWHFKQREHLGPRSTIGMCFVNSVAGVDSGPEKESKGQREAQDSASAEVVAHLPWREWTS